MVPIAFGTQTGGSVIRPASYCGVAAIKPSYRLLPTMGIKCYSISLDTAGLFAATVADAGFALSALTGRDFSVSGNAGATRIAVTRQGFAGEVEPASDAALEAAIEALERDGAKVRDIQDPPEFATAWRLHPIIGDGEALRSLAWEWETHRASIPPKLTEALSAAEAISPQEFDEARRAGKRARIAAHDFFQDTDAVITFSARPRARGPRRRVMPNSTGFGPCSASLASMCRDVRMGGACRSGSSDRALWSGRSGARGRLAT